MMQASQHRIPDYLMVTSPDSVDIPFKGNRDLLLKPLVRAGRVKVGDVFINEAIQMSLAQNQHVIQTLPPNTANETLTNRIGFRCTHRRSDDLDPPPFGDLCETLAVLTVVVSDQKAGTRIVRRDFPNLLGDPEIAG